MKFVMLWTDPGDVQVMT